LKIEQLRRERSKQSDIPLKKEVRKTRGLQQSHDKTRDEINLQARAFEENASVTCALKQEVLELRKQLATTNKENESQSRQISRLSSLNKDLEASKMENYQSSRFVLRSGPF